MSDAVHGLPMPDGDIVFSDAETMEKHAAALFLIAGALGDLPEDKIKHDRILQRIGKLRHVP
jgi:hypothetical protein